MQFCLKQVQNFVLLQAVTSYITRISAPNLNLDWSRKVLSNFQKQSVCHYAEIEFQNIMTPWRSLALPSLENSWHISFRQSQPKVVGTLKPYRVTPFPPNQCWKISRYFQQKGQKSPDYQHWKWGEGRTCFVFQLFCPGL